MVMVRNTWKTSLAKRSGSIHSLLIKIWFSQTDLLIIWFASKYYVETFRKISVKFCIPKKILPSKKSLRIFIAVHLIFKSYDAEQSTQILIFNVVVHLICTSSWRLRWILLSTRLNSITDFVWNIQCIYLRWKYPMHSGWCKMRTY